MPCRRPPTGVPCRAAYRRLVVPPPAHRRARHFVAQSALLGRVELLSKIEKKTTNRRPDVNKSAQPAFRRAGRVDILPSARDAPVRDHRGTGGGLL